MSYSFPLLVQVNRTVTFCPAQLATVPFTVSVKTSQFTPSTQAASVLTPPPGVTMVWSHDAVAPPGLGPTDPDVGFCARVLRNGIEHMRLMPHRTKSALMVTRAVTDDRFVFIMD